MIDLIKLRSIRAEQFKTKSEKTTKQITTEMPAQENNTKSETKKWKQMRNMRNLLKSENNENTSKKMKSMKKEKAKQKCLF